MSTELNTVAPKKWSGNYSGIAPTLDSGSGVSVGDLAIDTSTTPNRFWRCDVNTLGSQVWVVWSNGVATITAGITSINSSHSIILCNAASGSITLNLPTAVGVVGKTYNIKKIDSSENMVSVVSSGSQKIDGRASQDIYSQYVSITVVSDGSNWWIT